MERRIIVCEPNDRWTKLVRRRQMDGGFSVVRSNSFEFGKREIWRGHGWVFAIHLDDQNVLETLKAISSSGICVRHHCFVGLCDAVFKGSDSMLLSAGLSACFFSPVDVKSLVRLAVTHFEFVAEHIQTLNNDSPMTTVDRIWSELPQF